MASNVSQMYSERSAAYIRFVRSVGYPAGLKSSFLHSPLLRSDQRILDAGCGSGIVSFALRDALLQRQFRPGPIDAFDLTPAMLDQARSLVPTRVILGSSSILSEYSSSEAAESLIRSTCSLNTASSWSMCIVRSLTIQNRRPPLPTRC